MQRPIRVLEIISGFAVEGPLGGIERFGIELSQALNPEIVEPILCGLWAYDVPYERDWVRSLADKGVTRDLHPLPDPGSFLDFDKGPDLAHITDLAPIQIDESMKPDIFTQYYIRGNPQGTLIVHRLQVS